MGGADGRRGGTEPGSPVGTIGERDLQVGFTLGGWDPGAAARRAPPEPAGWVTASPGAVELLHEPIAEVPEPLE